MGGYSLATLQVEGMTCGACVAAVQEQVQKLESVQDVSVSLITGACQVKFDAQILEVALLEEAIEDCGFEARVLEVQEPRTTTHMASFQVHGMTCASCVASVTESVQQMLGVHEVSVALATEECRVVFDADDDDANTFANAVKTCIEDCGFDAELATLSSATSKKSGSSKNTQLKVYGLSNIDDSVAVVESALRQIPGIARASVSLENEAVTLQYDPTVIGVRAIAARIDALGYEAAAANSFDSMAQIQTLARVREIRFWKNSCIQACCGMLVMLLLYKFVPRWVPGVHKFILYQQTLVPGLFYRDIVGLVLSTYIQFWVGRHFYKAGWHSMRKGSGSMDTFVVVATMCAYTFSIFSMLNNIWKKFSVLPNVVFDASTMLIGFISVGKLLENKAKSKTNDSLSKLISLAPSNCTIIENGVATVIPVEFLQVGDIVEIKPGAKIPTDGIIIDGESEIDESLMTGESLMVPRYVNSPVVGGSINGPNHFLFKATSVGDDTKLAHIISTMKRAQLAKAPIQHQADYLAAKFVPCILTLALITFLTWFALSHHLKNPPAIFDDQNGIFFVCLQMTISVIVVACPCALGLAAPTAIMVGTGLGARHGVLIKGGDILENCISLDTILFDKTGTLTTGIMTVEQYVPMCDNTALSVDQAACVNALSALSDHPISKALKEYTSSYLLGSNVAPKITHSETVIGGGIIGKCQLNGLEHRVVIGNKSMLPKYDHLPDPQGTLSYVVIDDQLVGRFEVGDAMKKDAAQVVRYFSAQGHRVCMVTGDNHNSAMKAALELGIEANNVYSELTPAQKNDLVEELKDEGRRRVAFVGDGINDSPALVASDLGISISTGTDIAMEAADIIILSRPEPALASLCELVYALDISNATLRRVRLNFFWAICYNIFMVPIAMGALVPWNITLDPIIAVACMAASSVSVVGSSLLLNRWKPPTLHAATPRSSKRHIFSSMIKKLQRQRPVPLEDVELQTGLIA
ncbi:LAME_0D02124g1_1 [Lachancea meyersii CBS 8951]|uniref:P-type Cu(+) transporter n=1 Tax=Lachancea meyersii CBS 8951 TaxID=1266667 RepID=A0A1G4J798_9SACH|nr:LAME_0D02124g1_1 [Lachancea meyersii CBS 8951]